MTDLFYLSAVEALRMFAARELSPVELLDSVVARAEQVEPKVNAWAERRIEPAYAAAREAEKRWSRRGEDPRPLEGLPVALKEEQPIIGEPLRQGSLLMEDYLAEATHPIVERILAAGAVVHARTTTPEFSCAGFTHSRLWGLTRNPWNAEVSCGGSSGGSGAALAAGTTILATGSDIGGSIRIPAALNGVVGFKPPYARVPGMPPFNLDPYCHDGPMGRSVVDVALLENVIAGAHPSDHASLRDPPLLPLDPEPPAGLRVGLAVTLGDFPMDSELEAATRAFGRALSSAGVKVEEIEVDLRRQDVLDAMMIHFGAIFGPSVAEVAEGREELLTPYAAHFDRLSAEALEKHGYYRGLQLEASIQAAVGDAIDRYDALVCPTLATTGWAAGDEYIDHGLVVDDVELDFYFEALLTPVFNIASRHPVLNVPSGRASNGVPIGVQIVGRTYDDPTPFRIAAAAERLLGWWSDPTWRPSLV